MIPVTPPLPPPPGCVVCGAPLPNRMRTVCSRVCYGELHYRRMVKQTVRIRISYSQTFTDTPAEA